MKRLYRVTVNIPRNKECVEGYTKYMPWRAYVAATDADSAIEAVREWASQSELRSNEGSVIDLQYIAAEDMLADGAPAVFLDNIRPAAQTESVQASPQESSRTE